MKTTRIISRLLAWTVVAGFLVIPNARVLGQCANDNTLLAGGAITPNCPGTTNVPCITGGQYALLNVTAGNIYTFSTCGAPFDTQITIYNNAGGASVGFNDDSGICGFLSLQSYLVWTATFTGQLRVLVDQFPCANNTLCATMVVTCATPPLALVNDECPGARTLLVLNGCFMQTYTNTGATRSTLGVNPTCGGPYNNNSFRDVWFTFIAPANGIVVIESVPGTMQDGVMQLVQGTCAGFVNVECDDDDGVGLMPMIDRRCAPLTPGAAYMIRFWGVGGAQGSFGLCVRGFPNWTTPQEDCTGAATVCGNQQLNNSANFTGCVADLNATNRGCLLGNERQGSWYYFSPSAPGTIELTIAPTGNVDYDFAIWGPMANYTCPPVGPPVRCSWAYPPNIAGYPGAVAFQTGMRLSSTDPSEGAGPTPVVDGFTSALNVLAGQRYIMYIDNFDVTGQSFTLNWTLTGGASLDCTLTPVEFAGLNARMMDKDVLVEWSTASELNSDHFIVERSVDARSFEAIGQVAAAGFSNQRVDYQFLDKDARTGANYYRLKQLDTNGDQFLSTIIYLHIGTEGSVLRAVPNPASVELLVEIPQGIGRDLWVQVLDATGRPMLEMRIAANSGDRLSIPISGLAAGCYHLRIWDDQGKDRGKARFIKE